MATWDEVESLIADNNYQQLQKEIELKPDLALLGDEQGWTLLMISAARDAHECTRTLIEAGANINQNNPSVGLTAMMCAASWGNVKMTQYLLDHGAEISIRDNSGESAFDYAMQDNRDRANHEWAELFNSYKDRFDDKDLARYHEMRLSALFS